MDWGGQEHSEEDFNPEWDDIDGDWTVPPEFLDGASSAGGGITLEQIGAMLILASVFYLLYRFLKESGGDSDEYVDRGAGTGEY